MNGRTGIIRMTSTTARKPFTKHRKAPTSSPERAVKALHALYEYGNVLKSEPIEKKPEEKKVDKKSGKKK